MLGNVVVLGPRPSASAQTIRAAMAVLRMWASCAMKRQMNPVRKARSVAGIEADSPVREAKPQSVVDQERTRPNCIISPRAPRPAPECCCHRSQRSAQIRCKAQVAIGGGMTKLLRWGNADSGSRREGFRTRRSRVSRVGWRCGRQQAGRRVPCSVSVAGEIVARIGGRRASRR